MEGPRASKDAVAAIVRAKANWAAIHEKAQNHESDPTYLARFEPFSATLKDGVWHVQGTVPASHFHSGTLIELAEAPSSFLHRLITGTRP